MSSAFKTADCAATLALQVRVGGCLPPAHLARFVVATSAVLDLSAFHARYGARGGQPYDPALVLGVLFYGYVAGIYSSRKLERAAYESSPFRYIAGHLRPDRDAQAHFRRAFLPEIREAFVQILLLAQQVGVLDLGVVSQDGTKIHADASRSQAVSYRRQARLEQLALAGAVRRTPSGAGRAVFGHLFQHPSHPAAPHRSAGRTASMLIACYPFSPTGC